ncbi:alpha-1,6-mannosylglycoprotein 6-beta-N-acetylglucosaminyltransferase A-like [Hydractinia symbiolongicarpus]|uniref:alpha-1,6-mannosylglycoprotein 6-beta-N-acetylglucosaminyltransferase A-like n=1 Tax=Hydractinia symbiolongicarpus TaxID=13093 RepID=UPI00254F3271|nr:alpha-1,6-mannosylglycoprotein 6-beta-N-acetylglucosaminyltransferase A-like [Hydractinia symbiolongicarpus]
MKSIAISRINHRNIFILILICLIGLYVITLLRLESLIKHHSGISSIHNLFQKIEFDINHIDNSKNMAYEVDSKEKVNMHETVELKEFFDHGDEVNKKTVLKLTPTIRSCDVVKPHRNFPLCAEKMEYLQAMWPAKCFREIHGVDGSACSIVDYLSKVEPFCPNYEKYNHKKIKYASPRFDIKGLLELMPGRKFEWMRQRAKQLWPDWIKAGERFAKLKQKWKKKRVLAFMGSMGFQPHIMLNAGHGGPLGELVQWTDLISSLYILGYDVKVVLNGSLLIDLLDRDDKNNCASSTIQKDKVETIYTDVNGVIILSNNNGFASTAKYRCMIRVLDSFGTFPEYNYPAYPHAIPGNRSDWANHNLIPTQFLTLYPHTHDNYFLGFVVGSSKKNNKEGQWKQKKNKALLYAKLSSYFQEYIDYLKIISEYFELHATTVSETQLPSFIINHGPVSGSEVQNLLSQSKLFVGVGFPYEGPGPMEALAAGAVFMQPKYDEPKNKMNDAFFKDKPTLRKLTSQSPYMEEFVGEPYCYTIDIKNETLLRLTLQKIKDMKPLPPKIPKEFTNEGMLERVHVFTEHMNYCDVHAPRWPPVNHLKTFMSSVGQSCKDLCMSKGMICERTYFDDINTRTVIERVGNVSCRSIRTVNFLHPPSFDPISNICFLQQHGQLFSCMYESNKFRRLCPCRDYELEQSSICSDCL